MARNSVAHSFTGANFGPEEDHVWARLFDRTRGLLESCQSVFVLYSRFMDPDEYKEFSRPRGEYLQHLFQPETCVVDVFEKRTLLEAMGAKEPFFNAAGKLAVSLEREPESAEEKIVFAEAASAFASQLPLYDPAVKIPGLAYIYEFGDRPNFEELAERPRRYARKVLKHAALYTKLVKKEPMVQPEASSPSRTPSRHSTEAAEAVVEQYGQGEEASVNKGDPRGRNHSVAQDPRQTIEVPNQDLDEGRVSSMATTEAGNKVFVFGRYYSQEEIIPRGPRFPKMESVLQSKYTARKLVMITERVEALLEAAPHVGVQSPCSNQDAFSGVYKGRSSEPNSAHAAYTSGSHTSSSLSSVRSPYIPPEGAQGYNPAAGFVTPPPVRPRSLIGASTPISQRTPNLSQFHTPSRTFGIRSTPCEDTRAAFTFPGAVPRRCLKRDRDPEEQGQSARRCRSNMC